VHLHWRSVKTQATIIVIYKRFRNNQGVKSNVLGTKVNQPTVNGIFDGENAINNYHVYQVTKLNQNCPKFNQRTFFQL
jgi:hypothetical protein